jgi:hypothetical protein
MKKINIGFNILFIIFILIIVFWVTQINFDNLSFKENSSPYFGISSLLLMSFALKMIKRGIKKK